MCVLIFNTIFVWNNSHYEKNWARYAQKCILVFMFSTLYSCPVEMKLEFCRQMFEKCSNIKFRENASCGSRVVPCGQTEGQTDKMKLIVAFRNSANATKNRVSSSLHVLYSSPDITSVIKPRMMMWVGSCGTHVCGKHLNTPRCFF
jgi:hypothetical protein